MKNNLTFSLLLAFLANSLFSQSNIQQSLSVNADGSAPNPSAQLDVNATDKGMLVPRMTSAQRTAIASPATGLLVFDVTTGSFFFFNGTTWVDLSTPKALADADGDTKIQVEESPNEDIIRFDLGGTEHMVLRKNASGNARLEMANGLGNTLLGQNAGNSLINGSYNTANGTNALFSLTNSSQNTATGYSALFSNINGVSNTATGYNALMSNTSGNNNTAFGTYALNSNTSGFSNVAIGVGALRLNTDRSHLVAVGDSALFNNGTGVSFSYDATGNTAIGSKALFDNTTGFDNTALGWQALASNTFGDQNTASGKAALQNNTLGDANTASGWQALASNTTGNGNTANGRGALNSNTTGTSNVAIGSSAMSGNTTGSQHTAVGASALYFSSNGTRNTALGYEATTGFGNLSNATAIGAKAFVDASNCLVLGSISGVNNALESVNVGIGTTTPDVRLQVVGGTDVSLAGGGYIVSGAVTGINIGIDDNEIMARNNGGVSGLFLNNSGGNVKIGNASSLVGIGRTPVTNALEVDGAASKSVSGDWLANSDARLKKNIQPLNSQLMLQSLLALQGITYEWNDDKTGSKRPEGIQYGFTAQNIQTVFPTLVEEDKLGYLQTAYGTYDAMTVEAIRALHEENQTLKAKVELLTSQLDKITAALAGAGISVER